MILAKTGQPQEGEKILREAVKIRTDLLQKGHYWIALANSALGECLTIEKRYTEAEPLLIESYNDLKASQGERHPRAVEALQRIVELYQASGDVDGLEKYRALLSRRH